MRVRSYLSVAILALFFTSGLAPAVAADTAESNQAKAQAMIEKAEQARKKADSVNGEWRDTGKLVKQAKSALDKGETVKAMKLAAEAHKQSVLGYQQAVSQQQLQLPSYLRYE
jgi:hypothetical protein